MKIFANKTNLYNNNDFLISSVKQENLSGVGFNLAMTKDNKFMIFTPAFNNQATIQTIASKNLNEIENLDILTLDYILEFYTKNKTNLKIFFNLLPATIPVTSEETLETLKNINNNYVFHLTKALENYQNLNIYLGSINSNLIQLLKSKNLKQKLGIVLFGGNLNYMDVDFYVFETALLSDQIFKQQLDLGKEIILYIGTINDLNTTYEHFKGEKSTALAGSIFNQIYFLNDYPELFFNLFKEY